MPYPPEIERFHAAISSLPGVIEVSSGIQSLQGVSAEHLGLPHFRSLPIGALLRTAGGLVGEAFVQVEFSLVPNQESWRTIEFLAWFVRDQSRDGVPIQLRPFALPPEAMGQVQLGRTLRWHIDLFCPGTTADLSPQLQQLAEIASTLETAIKIYGNALSTKA